MNTTTSIQLGVSWELDPDFGGRAYPVGNQFVWLNGLPMHVTAYRVHQPDSEQVSWSSTFDTEVEALQELTYSAMRTTLLSGLEGEWVISITPHGI